MKERSLMTEKKLTRVQSHSLQEALPLFIHQIILFFTRKITIMHKIQPTNPQIPQNKLLTK